MDTRKESGRRGGEEASRASRASRPHNATVKCMCMGQHQQQMQVQMETATAPERALGRSPGELAPRDSLGPLVLPPLNFDDRGTGKQVTNHEPLLPALGWVSNLSTPGHSSSLIQDQPPPAHPLTRTHPHCHAFILLFWFCFFYFSLPSSKRNILFDPSPALYGSATSHNQTNLDRDLIFMHLSWTNHLLL